MGRRCKKLFCMGLAALLTFSEMPEVSAWAAEAAGQPGMEEVVSGTGDVTEDGLEYKELEDGTLEITGYSGSDTELVIPEAIEGKTVTSIGEDAFLDHRPHLTGIGLPEGLKNIGFRAFGYCSGLTGIEFPEGLQSIGDFAFWECSSLTTIEVPEGVMSIGKGAFQRCSALTSIELPKGFTFINHLLFCDCSALTSIELPEGITEIGGYAFQNCSGLTGIELPEGITKIGGGAFQNCSGLTSIKLPEGITRINEELFKGCSGLTSVELPDGILEIGRAAFDGCSSLTSMKLPDSITEIDSYVFANCSSLTSIKLPEDLTMLVNVGIFYGCSALESISIPAGVTEIDDYVFQGYDRQAKIVCEEGSYAYTYFAEKNFPMKKMYRITFEPESGEGLRRNSRTVEDGDAIGTLPTVTRTGYTFLGWFTEETGGETVTEDFQPVSSQTVYAQWEKVEEEPGDDSGKDPKDEPGNNSGNDQKGGPGNNSGNSSKDDPGSQQTKQSLEQAVVTLSATKTAYNGKAKKPAVKSVTLAGKTLSAGKDYTVTYQNNKNIGTASVTITGTGDYKGTVTKTFIIYVKKGTTVTSGAYKYRFTGNSEVAFAGIKSTKTTKVVIPKTVKLGGKTFKVTSIAKKALYNKSKVKSVTIGENVKTIGASAFQNCKKLSTITIKTTKLKSAGKNTFKGIKATAKIKVPSRKLKAYKKILKNKGQGSKVKIVKK